MTKSNIKYIRPHIPEFDIPVYEGQKYQDMVPDTFDLQERAELAINVLTRATDPEADFEQYFFVSFRRNPPVMWHSFADQCQMKFMEALPLLRPITGNTLNSEVEQRWMESSLHRIGPDGLTYEPLKGRPWALRGIGQRFRDVIKGEQFIDPCFGGRLISSMMLYYRMDRNPMWKEEAERLADGFADLAIDCGRYAYYSPSAYVADKNSTEDPGKKDRFDAAHVTFLVPGLVHLYKETGYEPAAKLADKFIRYTLEELDYFNSDGSFAPETPDGKAPPHFHMHSVALLAMVEHAHAMNDTELFEFSQKAFEYGKSKANTTLGYFPDSIKPDNVSKVCANAMADMIAIGLKLTEAGYGDYYDDIDRWVRNGLAERQLTPERAQFLRAQAERFPAATPDPTFETADDVLARNIGAFPGWDIGELPGKASVNEWGNGITQDATGNGARAIYYTWDHALRKKGSELRVNMLLNRASPWADVYSHIPYEGLVEVKIKQAVELSIRMPEWVVGSDVSILVNGKSRKVDVQGRYVLVGKVKPDDKVKMSFPISVREETVTVEGEKYTLTLKGNDVVIIDPPGQYCPLYQRGDVLKKDKAPMKTKARFVSDESILNW